MELAYIDPGSGSIILQALVAGFAAMAIAVRAYWSRIRSLFSRRGNAPSTSEAGVPED